MSGVQGLDQYGGGTRDVIAEAQGALVMLSAEGSNGSSEVLITPQQARKLAEFLITEAAKADDVTVIV